MRVLMYGWEFPPHISGGLGVACSGLTTALLARNHEIHFVLPRANPDNTPETGINLIDVGRFPVYTSAITTWDFILRQLERISRHVNIHAIQSPLSPYLTEEQYQEELIRLRHQAEGLSGPFAPTTHHLTLSGQYGPNLMSEVMRYAAVAGSIAAQVPHDIIHVHDWLTILAGLEARRISGKPLVFHAHALEFDRSGDHINPAIYDIERYGFEQADAIVAVSRMTRDLIVHRYGISPEKIHVVYNAVSSASIDSGRSARTHSQQKTVLFLGRITFQKGPEYFVEAAARVLEQMDSVRFVMAGSGDMTPRLIERIAELRLGRKFHFTGFLRGPEVEQIFRQSDLYVMPSVSEPFGISPLEAMSYDVPVIISNTSGVAEILQNALKVDFWDVEDLAQKILAVLRHEALRKELIERGSDELRKFQWKHAAEHVETLYHSLLYP